MELISKEETRKIIDEILCSIDYVPFWVLDKFSDSIESIPTIEERKEGEWLDNKWLGEKCSICNWELHYINFGQFKYCPNCGARMKGE